MPVQSIFNAWAQARQTAAANGQDAPLAGVDTSQYTYASFIYPLDLGAPGAGKDHYMVFHINETSTTQFQTAQVGGQAPGATVTTGTATPAINNTSSVVSSQPIKRVATTIVLYIPQYQVNYKADWQVENLGVAADIVGAAKGTRSLSDLLKSGGVSVLKNLGVEVNSLTDTNLSAATSAAARIAINPHQEVIFTGIGFSQFQFNFRFTAQSEAEALNVDNIIKAFKFYAAPEVFTGAAGRFWIYPAEFDIEFYSNGDQNQFLNKISTCALTDMTVNYTSAGEWASHRPHSSITGAPSVCTDIQLTFQELEIMTKQRILEGY